MAIYTVRIRRASKVAGRQADKPPDDLRKLWYEEAVRIGLFIPILQERPAGVGVYIDEICSRLIRLNSDAIVYTSTTNAQRPWLDGVSVRRIGRSRSTESGIAAGPRRRARRLIWLASECTWQLPRDGVDILFSPVQEGPLLRGTVPTCIVMHDLTALKYPSAYDSIAVAQTRWILPRMLRCARLVVAVSENTRRDVIDAFNIPTERIRVVGEGCDRAVFYPRDNVRSLEVRMRLGLPGRYLLYAGTFSRHKNLGVILEAMTRLPDDAKDVVFVVVGRTDAGDYAEFEAQTRRLSLTTRVRALGYVSRDELAALMSAACAFVYPSRYEGFGLAALEAMACGATVVASDVASLPEIVGRGGILVPNASPDAWARAIQEALVADRRLARTRAVQQAALFQWDDAAAEILRLLRNMTQRV